MPGISTLSYDSGAALRLFRRHDGALTVRGGLPAKGLQRRPIHCNSLILLVLCACAIVPTRVAGIDFAHRSFKAPCGPPDRPPA